MRRFLLIIFLTCFSLTVFANQAEYPPITPENARHMEEVELLGTGSVNPVIAWSEDGKIAVGGKNGFYLYENLQSEAEYIEIDIGFDVKSLLFVGEILIAGNDDHNTAYDVANRQPAFVYAGQRPLAVSESGTLLAYEVDMGVEVMEIATGNILYRLNYNTLLGWDEANTLEDDYYQEYRFYDAQFFNNDTELVVSWTYIYHAGWEGRSDSGTEFWKLEDLSWTDISDYLGGGTHEGFMGMDSNNEAIMQQNFELEDACREVYTFDFEIRSILVGDYFAVACEGDNHQGNYTGVWNWHTGELLTIIPEIGVMQLNPALGQLAIDTEIYDIATGQSLATLLSTSYAFSSGMILEYGADNRLRLLDANSYAEIAVLPVAADDLLSMNEYSNVFIHKNQREAWWINKLTGQTLAHFTADRPVFDGWTSWGFNASGSFALSRNLNHDEAYLWDVATGQALNPEYRIIHDYFHDGLYLLIKSANEISLMNPVDESISWRFSYEGNLIDVLFRDEYFILFGNTIDIYELATEEVVLSLPNTYGNPAYFEWSDGRIAYYDGNDIVIQAFPDGAIIQRITPETYGFLDIYEDTLIIRDEETYRSTYYDIASGELSRSPYNVNAYYPCIETETLNFFCDGNIRIETKDGRVLRETPMAFVTLEAILSSDESRLLILYPEGTISVWAVPE